MKTTPRSLLPALAAILIFSSCTSHYSARLDVHPASLDGKSRVIGFVSDKTTGEMLPGANIYIPGTNLGAQTSIDGYYRIDQIPPGRHRIQVSRVGHYSVKDFEVLLEPDKLIRLDFEILEFPILVQ